jgi:hypothetical protein
VERYTNGESSSIPVEKAQELLQSITYIIGFYLKETPDWKEKLKLLQNEKMNTLFYRGMEAIEKRKKEANKLLLQIQRDTLKLNNIAYQDTIHNELPEFFHNYDVEYGSHKLDASADYPILHPITEYLGLEYMEEYLKRLAIEGTLIGRFQADRINLLIHNFDKEAEQMLINIYELILINILGCRLVDKDIYELVLNNMEIALLQNKLQNLSEEELYLKLYEAFSQISIELMLSEEEQNYAGLFLREAAIRLSHCLQLNTLSKFFIVDQEQDILEIDSFEDGRSMENEELCEFIVKIANVADVQGKVNMIKNEVHSIEDLTEILDTCFNEEEFSEVFSLLGEPELAVLKKYILSDLGGIDVKDYDTEKQWQRVLLGL